MGLRPMPLLGPMLIRGMDTTVTKERGLLRLCLLLRPRLPPRLRLIPGMDTMDMDTGERSKKPEYCQLILNIVLFLPTLKHLNTSVYKTFSFENFKNILFCLIGCRDLFQQSNKVSKSKKKKKKKKKYSSVIPPLKKKKK